MEINWSSTNTRRNERRATFNGCDVFLSQYPEDQGGVAGMWNVQVGHRSKFISHLSGVVATEQDAVRVAVELVAMLTGEISPKVDAAVAAAKVA